MSRGITSKRRTGEALDGIEGGEARKQRKGRVFNWEKTSRCAQLYWLKIDYGALKEIGSRQRGLG